MSKTVTKPIFELPVLKDHIFENADFLSSVFEAIASEKNEDKSVSLDVGATDSTLEVEVLDAHHAKLDLRYVIDTDLDSSNGRIYLEDHFEFDPSSKNLSTLQFSRSVSKKSGSGYWNDLEDYLNKEIKTLPSDASLQKFFKNVIRKIEIEIPVEIQQEPEEIEQERPKAPIEVLPGNYSDLALKSEKLYWNRLPPPVISMHHFSYSSSFHNILSRQTKVMALNSLDLAENKWLEFVKDPGNLLPFLAGASCFRFAKILGFGLLSETGIASGFMARSFSSALGIVAETSAFEATGLLQRGQSFENYSDSFFNTLPTFTFFHASSALWQRLIAQPLLMHFVSIATFHGVNEWQRSWGSIPSEGDYSARLLLDAGFYVHASAAGGIAHEVLGPEHPLFFLDRNPSHKLTTKKVLEDTVVDLQGDEEIADTQEMPVPVFPKPQTHLIFRSPDGSEAIEASSVSPTQWRVADYVRIDQGDRRQYIVQDLRTSSRRKNPVFVNGNRINSGDRVYIKDGALLKIEGVNYFFRVNHPGYFERSFYELDSAGQRSARDQVAQANGFNELKLAVERLPIAGAEEEGLGIESCLAGKARLDSLSPLVRTRMIALMEAESASMWPHLPQGFDATLNADHPLQGGIRVEQRYYILRAALFLRKNIQVAGSVDELITLLHRVSLSNLEGNSRETLMRVLVDYKSGRVKLRDIPKDFGIQQRVADLEEAKFYRLHEEGVLQADRNVHPSIKSRFYELERQKGNLFAYIRSLGRVIGSARSYRSDELIDLVHEVLDRGKPLEIIPTESGVRERVRDYMNQAIDEVRSAEPAEFAIARDSNYFTGEKFGNTDNPLHYMQSRYRFARMLLNQRMNLPIFGEPTQREQGILTAFSKTDLSVKGDIHYANAQQAIREHLQRFSPEIQKGLREADQETRALVMETFFGISQHRYMFDPYKAFEVARFLGEVGFYREVGVTIELRGRRVFTNLSLGDLGSVSPEKSNLFFVLHTHPEEYLNAQGQLMGQVVRQGDQQGRTIALDVGSLSRDTRNVLFSHQDVRLFKQHAEEIYRQLKAQPQLDLSIFYDPARRIFRNWVQHPFGMSEMRVYLGPTGVAEKIEIDYGVKPEAGNDYRHFDQARSLRDMNSEFHLPVQVQEKDVITLQRGLPYVK